MVSGDETSKELVKLKLKYHSEQNFKNDIGGSKFGDVDIDE